jgi:hypothetical protein
MAYSCAAEPETLTSMVKTLVLFPMPSGGSSTSIAYGATEVGRITTNECERRRGDVPVDGMAYTASSSSVIGDALRVNVRTGAPTLDGKICCMLPARRVRCGDQESVTSLQHAVVKDMPASMLRDSGEMVPSMEVVVQNTVYDEEGTRGV